MGVAGQEEEEDSEPEPEPEGEPEPEIGKYCTREYYTGKYYTCATTSELNWALECYVCTYEDDEAVCATNQTTDSNVETCAPGMHCSVRLTPEFFNFRIFLDNKKTIFRRHISNMMMELIFINEVAQNHAQRYE